MDLAYGFQLPDFSKVEATDHVKCEMLAIR